MQWYHDISSFILVVFCGFPKATWQFQFAHGNSNLLEAVLICLWQFQFTHTNFNLLIL